MINDLILASSSPQRKRILKDLGISYTAVTPDIDEHHNDLRMPYAIVKNIALRKAQEIAKQFPAKWVLGCDTLVVPANGKIAVKPKNKETARNTLKSYSKSYCDVYSGLALMNLSENKTISGWEKTRLLFHKIPEDEIEKYLKTDEWKVSSGSMTIEGKAGKWIKKIQGDYWNVVGLPSKLLLKFLNNIQSELT